MKFRATMAGAVSYIANGNNNGKKKTWKDIWEKVLTPSPESARSENSSKIVSGAVKKAGLRGVFTNSKLRTDIGNIIREGEASGKTPSEIMNEIRDYVYDSPSIPQDRKDKVWGAMEGKLDECIKQPEKKIDKNFFKESGIAEALKGMMKDDSSEKTQQTGNKKWSKTEPVKPQSQMQDNADVSAGMTAAGKKQWGKTEPLKEEASGSSSGVNESEYVCIDSRVIDRCIEQKDSFISRYDKIVTDYNQIVDRLSQNWKGKGADTFIKDARVVRTNIKGIADILASMVNVLTDIRQVIGDVDRQLGENNRNPEAEG